MREINNLTTGVLTPAFYLTLQVYAASPLRFSAYLTPAPQA